LKRRKAERGAAFALLIDHAPVKEGGNGAAGERAAAIGTLREPGKQSLLAEDGENITGKKKPLIHRHSTTGTEKGRRQDSQQSNTGNRSSREKGT